MAQHHQQQGMDSALFERRLRPVYGELGVPPPHYMYEARVYDPKTFFNFR